MALKLEEYLLPIKLDCVDINSHAGVAKYP